MNRRTLFAALTSVAVLSVAAGAAAQTPDDYPEPARSASSCRRRPAPGSTCRRACSRRRWASSGASRASWTIVRAPTPSSGWKPPPRRQPDGYTLVYAPVSAVTTNAFIYKKLPYDALRDFAPITQTTANPLGAVVNPASGIKSIKDLVERAKANPGQLNYGSFGIGNMTHLMGVLLSLAADIKMTHVPYRGQTPAITDVLAGQIPLAFTTTAGATDLVEIGKARSARHVRPGAR